MCAIEIDDGGQCPRLALVTASVKQQCLQGHSQLRQMQTPQPGGLLRLDRTLTLKPPLALHWRLTMQLQQVCRERKANQGKCGK